MIRRRTTAAAFLLLALGSTAGIAAAGGFAGDCNRNGIEDSSEISLDPALDLNDNAVIDACETRGDLDGSGSVDAADLVMLLASWGACETDPCHGDLDSDDLVGVNDLIILLISWG